MKAVLCTGTPGSGADHLWNMLLASGIENAMPAENSDYTFGILAQKIVETYVTDEQNKIEPDVEWSDHALNIFEANQGHQFWGWYDPDSIYLLDFWKEINSELFFLLVYSDPSEDFCRNMMMSQGADYKEKEFLDNWFNYNRQLLRFYNRNMDRAVLVNSHACLTNTEVLLQKIIERTGIELESVEHNNQENEEQISSIAKLLAFNNIRNRTDIRTLSLEIESTATIPGNKNHGDVLQEAWEEYFLKGQLVEIKDAEFKRLKEDTVKLQHNNEKQETAESEIEQLKNEVELNLLQLNEMQDELEHYFQLYKENEAKIAAQATAIQEGRYLVGMNEPVDGENWYKTETDTNGDFRWTGPETRTVIRIPVKRNRELLLLIEYRDTFTAEQLAKINIEVDGKITPHSVYKSINPKYILAHIPISEAIAVNKIEIAILLPHTVSPASLHNDMDDTRKLGICINSIAVIPFNERLYIEEPASQLGWLRKKVLMLKYRLTGNDSPLAYFDGIGYLEANKDVAESVERGLISSAWDHYVSYGIKDKKFSFSTSRRPSYGNLIDLIRFRSE